MYLYGLIVPILSFFLQVWPRLINRYFGVDTWRHLMVADYVRKHKHLPEKIRDKYVFTDIFTYPPVIIYFLSFFPKKFAEKYQFIFSPIFDSINNLIIFLATIFLAKDLRAAILAQIVAATTPITVIEASSLSSRILSHLVFYSSVFPLLLFTWSHNLLWLMMAAVMLFTLFFTHKLAIQAYLFMAVGFSLIEGSLFYVIFFLSVFLLVLTLGGRVYKAILADHIGVLSYFKKNIDLRFAHQFRGIKKEENKKDFISRLYSLSFKNPYVYILGNNLWIGIILGIWLLNYFHSVPSTININEQIFTRLNIWIGTLLVVAVSTLAIKPIRFLGEGNRYVEYCVLPVSIILGLYFSRFWLIYGLSFITFFAAVVLLLLLTIIYIQKKAILQDKGRSIREDLWQVIKYLKAHEKEKIRIAFFPNTMGDAVMYFIKARALLTDSGIGMHKLSDVIPVVSKPMDEIIATHKLNYILIEQSYVTLKELKLKSYKDIHEFGSYMLIHVP